MKSRIFYVAWVLTAVLMVATLPWLPAQLGEGGPPFNRGVHLAWMLLSVAMAGVCSKGCVQWLGKVMPQQMNLPHSVYWMAEERRADTLERLGEHVSGMGLLLLLLLVGAQLFCLLQGQPDWPQPAIEVWWLAAAVLGLAAVAWGWQAYRLFPSPPSAGHAAARQPRRPRTPG